MDNPIFLRLKRFSDSDKLLINVADIIKVAPRDRGTAIVVTRDGTSEHCLESVDDIESLLKQLSEQLRK